MATRVIAIDGPSASGKSTVARFVAHELGDLYVDSGAVYRGVTWQAQRRGLNVANTPSVNRMLRSTKIEFFVRGGAVLFTVDGQEPGLQLRTPEVSAQVSPIAAIPAVRMQVVSWLREMRMLGALVMEGRDIGTAVFPDAPFKFYLDASPEERARRRFREIAQSPVELTPEHVAENLRDRDKRDSTRAMDPLRVAPGAVVIDSTAMQLEAVVSTILAHVRGEAT